MLNISNPAELRLLTWLMVDWGPTTIRLFKSDTTLDEDTDTADFTEATFSGYAGVVVDWTPSATDGDGKAYTTSDTATFTASSGSAEEIYGWYCTDANDEYIFGERFPAPFDFDNTVPPVSFAVKFTLRQEE